MLSTYPFQKSFYQETASASHEFLWFITFFICILYLGMTLYFDQKYFTFCSFCGLSVIYTPLVSDLSFINALLLVYPWIIYPW